ncbi:kinase, PfkB family [Ancylostoma ceylanicum]|uniref:Adenosine kinase n=1 Tax=Ancylostoma ceylanicum TaxID=53326 RepID=A0A0D6M8I3_9BILA|nr:kinase, PfkB family [Ancylostoma ceylanicum]
MANLSEGVLLGCGNPLLDLQATVGKDFLDKWNLKENDAILCDDQHNAMFDELSEKYQVEYVPGGATQNAVRVCQWILNNPNRAAFFGAIGKDKYGDLLRTKAKEAGVNAQYQVNDKVKTGTCAALINGQNRSLCAHLAAANTFTIDHMLDPAHASLIEKAQFFYIAGFFLTVSPPSIMHVAEHSHKHNKTFMFNLAAPFISQFFFEPLKAVLPYVDIIFGNEDEAAAFAKKSSRPRTVIITQGADPIIVAVGNEITLHEVQTISKEKIVDTNGAGDAFVGGFLSQYIQGKSLKEAIECGNYAAGEIIQKHGCTFPSTCKYH